MGLIGPMGPISPMRFTTHHSPLTTHHSPLTTAMRHLKAGRTLGRNAAHRLALFRNLSRALIEHGRIITTVEKAKELRPFVEKLVTLAKKGTLHARRLALQRLPDKDSVAKLFKEIGPRFA